MLLSTHIIEDVQSVCDQIVVIHQGTILFTGTPEQLIQSAAGHVGVFWEKDETLEQGLHITARVNTSQGIRCRAVADKLPPYAQAEEPSLEDAYLYLISREAYNEDNAALSPGTEAAAAKPSDLADDGFVGPLPGAGAGTLQARHIHHHALHVSGKPAIAGGVAAPSSSACLTIFELDRACRSRVDILTDAVVSPLTTALTRLLALLTAAVLTVGLTMLVWLPISAGLIGAVFTGVNFSAGLSAVHGAGAAPGHPGGGRSLPVHPAGGLSIVLFIAFCALSLTVWAAEWQLCWLNPCVWALSDDFSNFRVFRSVAWMRFTWLLALAGVWTISYLCIRQYGKGVFGSPGPECQAALPPGDRPGAAGLFRRRLCRPALYRPQQPGFNVMSSMRSPMPRASPLSAAPPQVFPDTDAGTVTGRASYQFRNTSGQEQSISFGINPGYAISNVKANGADVPFTVSDYQEYNEALLEVTIPAEEKWS